MAEFKTSLTRAKTYVQPAVVGAGTRRVATTRWNVADASYVIWSSSPTVPTMTPIAVMAIPSNRSLHDLSSNHIREASLVGRNETSTVATIPALVICRCCREHGNPRLLISHPAVRCVVCGEQCSCQGCHAEQANA